MPCEGLEWANLPGARDPVLAEWLEGASCGPHVKALVVRAVHASSQGLSAAQWRHDLLAEHPSASALLGEAEECMRESGLWPWAGDS